MNLSFLVITSFIFLFFVFVLIKPDSSGYAVSEVVGGLGISEEYSIITLVLAFVTLLVFLGIIFFVYKKLISKKHKKGIPMPPVAEKKDVLEGLDKGKDLFGTEGLDKKDALNIPNKEPSLEKNLLEKDSSKKEEGVHEENEEPKSIKSTEVPKEKPIEKNDQKILTNLNQLKSGIFLLLQQRHTKQDILKILEAKGWSVEQVIKAIDEINLDNLKAYVKKSLSLGFDKERISEYLRRNGWDESTISKAVQK